MTALALSDSHHIAQGCPVNKSGSTMVPPCIKRSTKVENVFHKDPMAGLQGTMVLTPARDDEITDGPSSKCVQMKPDIANPPTLQGNCLSCNGEVGQRRLQAFVGAYATLAFLVSLLDRVTKTRIPIRQLGIFAESDALKNQLSAQYHPNTHEVHFGFDKVAGETVYTCNSVASVAHQIAHAMMCSIKPHHHPDALAEGLADFIAFVQVLQSPLVRHKAVVESTADVATNPGFIADLGEQVGRPLRKDHGVRCCANKLKVSDIAKGVRGDPHALSQVLSGGLFDLGMTTYEQKMQAGEGSAEACLLTAFMELLEACLLALFKSQEQPISPTWEFLQQLSYVLEGEKAQQVSDMIKERELRSLEDQASFGFCRCVSHTFDVSAPFKPLHMVQQMSLEKSMKSDSHFAVLEGCTAVHESEFEAMRLANAEKAPVKLLEAGLKAGWALVDDPHKHGLRTMAVVHHSSSHQVQCLRFGGDHGHHTFAKNVLEGRGFLVNARRGASLRCCACANCPGPRQTCDGCGKDFHFHPQRFYIAEKSIEFSLCETCSTG